MDKEKILALWREENKDNDEREVQIKDKSFFWVMASMIITASIFAFIRQLKGETVWDLEVTVCTAMTVGQIYIYVKQKKKSDLKNAIFTGFMAVMGLIMYIMGK